MNGRQMVTLVVVLFAIGFAIVVGGYYAGKSLAKLEDRADTTPASRDEAGSDASPSLAP